MCGCGVCVVDHQRFRVPNAVPLKRWLGNRNIEHLPAFAEYAVRLFDGFEATEEQVFCTLDTESYIPVVLWNLKWKRISEGLFVLGKMDGV
jgi:hypothetical protein